MPLSPLSPNPRDTPGSIPSPAADALQQSPGNGGARRGPHHTRSSHLLHQLGNWSSRASAGVTVSCLLSVWAVVRGGDRLPIVVAGGAGLDDFRCFAIQHTQRREQLVIQRKLDELVRAQPDADDRMIAAEGATDAQLDELMDANEP